MDMNKRIVIFVAFVCVSTLLVAVVWYSHRVFLLDLYYMSRPGPGIEYVNTAPTIHQNYVSSMPFVRSLTLVTLIVGIVILLFSIFRRTYTIIIGYMMIIFTSSMLYLLLGLYAFYLGYVTWIPSKVPSPPPKLDIWIPFTSSRVDIGIPTVEKDLWEKEETMIVP